MATSLRDLRVIDADTHVVEPADLWTTRMPSRWGELIPEVRFDPVQGVDAWFIGGQAIFRCGSGAPAGFDEWAPAHPIRHGDIDPANADPVQRLKRMDEHGIHAQVLYPNVGIFSATKYLGSQIDPAFAADCVRAYNDFLLDFAGVAPDRYVPIMTLPFWDLDATRVEMERCRALGHKGIVLTSRPEDFGLPVIGDLHWDPLWAQAQDLELSINFHIGSGKIPKYGHRHAGVHANYAFMSTMLFIGNAHAISALITGGVCHRFPRLDIVSVESGIGWIPFLLETLDWQWLNSGVRDEHPEMELLPSEYFRRQVYGCFWFEGPAGDAAIELMGADNFLFETDFPHATSLTPGPKSTSLPPLEHFELHHGHLSAETKRKVLHDNAARIYHLDPNSA